jgi:hypothetical protein
MRQRAACDQSAGNAEEAATRDRVPESARLVRSMPGSTVGSGQSSVRIGRAGFGAENRAPRPVVGHDTGGGPAAWS